MKILFHAINGVGLGHLNRSIIFAKTLKKLAPHIDIRIATETKFTKMLDDSNFMYYKLPYSHVDITKHSLGLIKNENKKNMVKIINEFNPDIIIYDTYPFYEVLNDPCSIGRKNILVLRKLNNAFLKNMLTGDAMKKIDFIIFPHTEEEFEKRGVTPDDIKKTGVKFKFTGSLIKDINENILNDIKRKYRITSDKFNILVIAGGGGEDEYNRGVKSFFDVIKNVNQKIKSKIRKLNLIVITGPLFKGKLKINGAAVKSFEPDIMELMKSVNLVISTGGYNICNEICRVETPAIIIPLPRHEESQKERADLLAKSEAITSMDMNEDKISNLITNLYNNPSKLNMMKKSFKKINLKVGNEVAAREILKIIQNKDKKQVVHDPILKHFFENFYGLKKITVVIPTYNRNDILRNCLISIFRQNYPKDKYEVIVVDDGSTDNTEKMIKSLNPKCNLKYFYWPRTEEFKLGEPKNRAGLARNIGIENAEGKAILFVDSDMIMDKNCVRRHAMMHEKNKNAVVIGYRNLLFKNTEKDIVEALSNKKIPFQDDFREISSVIDKKPWRLLYSNNASVKKSDLVNVGMFEKTFTNKYWGVEDIELGYKLFNAGLSFIFDKKAVGYHQYHEPEYITLHNMLTGLRNNWEFIHKMHQSEETYNKFLLSYDYELLSLGKNCNNDCSICSIVQHKGYQNKTMEQIKNEMEQFREKSGSLLISGGEPTIRPDIVDIISYAKSLNFNKIALETNGRMLSYKDFCSNIISAGANQFFVYIHGPTAKIHESITNTKGSFEQTLAGIKNLTEMNQAVEAKVCVTKENYKHLLDTFVLLNNCGVGNIQFLIPRMPERAGIIPKYVEIAKEIKKIHDYTKKERVRTRWVTLFI